MDVAVVCRVLQRYCYFAAFHSKRRQPLRIWKALPVALMVFMCPFWIMNSQPADTFDLILNLTPPDGGSISPAAGTYSLKRDSVVSLSSSPTSGFLFDHWSGGVAEPLSSSTTVTLDTNKTVTAWFSLLPEITVNSPNGGEEWMEGTTHDITWTSAGISGDIQIDFSANGGDTWTHVAVSTSNDGTYEWTVPGNVSANCLIRIADASGSPSDQSDAAFSIRRAPVDQQISLSAGWNIFSLNVVPENTGMKQIVQQLIDRGSLVKVQDEAGNTLERNPVSLAWENRIGNWNPAEGYRIRMGSNDVLTVYGLPVEDPVTIRLQAGWNIIGYPLSFPVNATEILSSLMGSGALVKVQDETGYTLEQLSPVSEWINNIGTLDPGEGYQIRVSSDYVFTFTPVFLKSAGTSTVLHNKPHSASPPR